MQNKLIKKYNGQEALLSNCRKMNGQFYEKNIDCFFINNKWYRIDSGLIVFDYEKQEYSLKNSELINGVVDYDEELGVIREGYFTPNIYENVKEINFKSESVSIDTNSDFNLISAVANAVNSYRIIKNSPNSIDISSVRQSVNTYSSAKGYSPYASISQKIPIYLNLIEDVPRIINYSGLNMFFNLHYGFAENLFLKLVNILKEKTIFKDSMNLWSENDFDRMLDDDISFEDACLSLFSEVDSYRNFRGMFFCSIDEINYTNSEIVEYKQIFQSKFSYVDEFSNEEFLYNISTYFEMYFDLKLKTTGIFQYFSRSDLKEFISIFERFFSSIEGSRKVNFYLEDFIFEQLIHLIYTTNISQAEIERYKLQLFVEENTVNNNKSKIFINSKVAKKCKYIELIGTDYFGLESRAGSSLVSKVKKEGYGKGLDYNIGSSNILQKEIENNFKNYNLEISEKASILSNITEKYSFGIEYETSSGYIPKRYLYKTALVPLKDGSLDGGIEYTTLPLQGASGIQSIINQCKLLSKYCTINDRCSYHVHIGNVPKTKEFGLAFYMLFKQIQEELFEIIPPYKKDVEWLIRRKKDYCKSLRSLNLFSNSIVRNNEIDKDSLNKEFNKLFLFLTEGVPESEHNNLQNGIHPRSGQGKWNWKSRYYALNMINLYFAKSGTVEFRMHTPTINVFKVLNWLFICIAIVKYAEENTLKILGAKDKINLNEVLSVYNNLDEEGLKVSEYLQEYVLSRKESFDEYYYNNNFYDSSINEIDGDKSYSFIRNYFINYEQ
jgi:hypothetical protein